MHVDYQTIFMKEKCQENIQPPVLVAVYYLFCCMLAYSTTTTACIFSLFVVFVVVCACHGYEVTDHCSDDLEVLSLIVL